MLFLVSVLSAPVGSDEPISSAVTYNREVFRIFESKCLACHATDGVAMSLATYREARPWARAIREELIEGRMPPWPAAPGYGTLANDIGLTARELATILTWTDGGAPRGDDRDLPARAAGHRHAAPAQSDARVELPPQRIPAGAEHIVRRLTVDSDAAGARWIRQIDVVPGNTRVMRAAFAWIVPAGGASNGGVPTTPARRGATTWVAAWTPWLRATAPPAGAAFALPRGARLLVELHYRGRDTDLEDASALALSFVPEPQVVADDIVVRTMPAPAARGGVRQRGQVTLRRAVRVWAVIPETSASDAPAASLEVVAQLPNGSVEVLLWAPRQRHDWPTPFILQAPVLLPAGTTVVVTAAASSEDPAQKLPVSTVTLGTYGSSEIAVSEGRSASEETEEAEETEDTVLHGGTEKRRRTESCFSAHSLLSQS